MIKGLDIPMPAQGTFVIGSTCEDLVIDPAAGGSLLHQPIIINGHHFRHSSLIPAVNQRPWRAKNTAVARLRQPDPTARLSLLPHARSGPGPAARSGPPTSSAAICIAASR